MTDDFQTLYESDEGDDPLPVRLEGADVEHPPGQRYRHHRLVVGDGRPGVVIVAQKGDRLLLVRSKRLAVGEELWELPRGSSEASDQQDGKDDSDATLVAAAKRELAEETGYEEAQVVEASVLGRYFTDTTVFPQRVAVVHCVLQDELPKGTKDGEIQEDRFVELRALLQDFRKGESGMWNIRDAHTIAALGLLAVHGLLSG